MSEQPETEYGDWTRGNTGQVGRTVMKWWWSDAFSEWLPVVEWEPHPDEKQPVTDTERTEE